MLLLCVLYLQSIDCGPWQSNISGGCLRVWTLSAWTYQLIGLIGNVMDIGLLCLGCQTAYMLNNSHVYVWFREIVET